MSVYIVTRYANQPPVYASASKRLAIVSAQMLANEMFASENGGNNGTPHLVVSKWDEDLHEIVEHVYGHSRSVQEALDALHTNPWTRS